jgi:hypothetical protein
MSSTLSAPSNLGVPGHAQRATVLSKAPLHDTDSGGANSCRLSAGTLLLPSASFSREALACAVACAVQRKAPSNLQRIQNAF